MQYSVWLEPNSVLIHQMDQSMFGLAYMGNNNTQYVYLLGAIKYYVSKKVGGWGQKMEIFAVLQYGLQYAEVGRWVGLK